MIWKLNTLTCSESMTRIPADKKIRLLRETGSSRLLRTRNQLWYEKRSVINTLSNGPQEEHFEKSIFYSLIHNNGTPLLFLLVLCVQSKHSWQSDKSHTLSIFARESLITVLQLIYRVLESSSSTTT